jgi:hypothetical protein
MNSLKPAARGEYKKKTLQPAFLQNANRDNSMTDAVDKGEKLVQGVSAYAA